MPSPPRPPAFRNARHHPLADVPFHFGAGHRGSVTEAEEITWYPSGAIASHRRLRRTELTYDPNLAREYVDGGDLGGAWRRLRQRIVTAFVVAPGVAFLGLATWAGLTLWGLGGLLIAVGLCCVIVAGASRE